MALATSSGTNPLSDYQNINAKPIQTIANSNSTQLNHDNEIHNTKKILFDPQSEIKNTLHNQNILIGYAAETRNSIVDKNSNSLEIDTKLLYAMDFISQKIANNNLFIDEVTDLYQQIELSIKKTANVENQLYHESQTSDNKPSNKQYLVQEFLITCIALSQQVRITNSSLSAMLIAQLNNVSKQTISRDLMDSKKNLETEAWEIISASVSVEIMMQFNFGTRHIKQNNTRSSKKPKVAPPEQPMTVTVKEKKQKNTEEDLEIQELKFTQAKHQKTLDKYSKNVSLIWFAQNNLKHRLPKKYIEALKSQLIDFQHYKQPIKFTFLTDYQTFKNNSDDLLLLVKKHGNRFEIQFVEDIAFEDPEVEKVHQHFLKQQYAGDPKKASKFYQIAFNMEHSISPALQHNAYFSFYQLYELTMEKPWDKIKRIFRLEQNKLITVLNNLFNKKRNAAINGSKYLYIPEINLKKTLLKDNNLL
jgi:hypothetical protein